MVKKERRGGKRAGAGRKPKFAKPVEFAVADHSDHRGRLRVLDSLPFRARRAFVIDCVPRNAKRASHAHRTCHQLLFCADGRFVVTIDDGRGKQKWKAIRTGMAFLVPAMHWIVLSDFTRNAICLVLASELYDESDVIRDWDEFMEAVR